MYFRLIFEILSPYKTIIFLYFVFFSQILITPPAVPKIFFSLTNLILDLFFLFEILLKKSL